MPKFRSKAATTIGEGVEISDGATVDAHVVSAEERTLQVPVAGTGGRVEHLTVGDALVTMPDKSQHVVRAAQFTAQFEPAGAKESKRQQQPKNP